MKLKENFPNLSAKKIKDIYKTINNTGKPKPHINITIKRLLCKQIIVFIDNESIIMFMISSGEYIANINHALKSTKSNISINFIHFDYCSFIVTSNKVAFPFDLGVVENYIRNVNSMD